MTARGFLVGLCLSVALGIGLTAALVAAQAQWDDARGSAGEIRALRRVLAERTAERDDARQLVLDLRALCVAREP